MKKLMDPESSDIFLVATSVCSEGVNFPNVKLVLILGCHDLLSFVQMANRVGRRFGGNAMLIQPNNMISSWNQLDSRVSIKTQLQMDYPNFSFNDETCQVFFVAFKRCFMH